MSRDYDSFVVVYTNSLGENELYIIDGKKVDDETAKIIYESCNAYTNDVNTIDDSAALKFYAMVDTNTDVEFCEENSIDPTLIGKFADCKRNTNINQSVLCKEEVNIIFTGWRM